MTGATLLTLVTIYSYQIGQTNASLFKFLKDAGDTSYYYKSIRALITFTYLVGLNLSFAYIFKKKLAENGTYILISVHLQIVKS